MDEKFTDRDRKLVRLGLDLCVQGYPITDERIDSCIEAAGLKPPDVPEITMEEFITAFETVCFNGGHRLAELQVRSIKEALGRLMGTGGK